ncbi:MAG: adenylate/guanylate cyclase domain-containing protein [Candidatus Muiribacteriota bacterium]
MIKFIKLYTKFSILNTPTKKLTYLRDIDNRRFTKEEKEEVIKFLDKIIETEKSNVQISKSAVRIKETLLKDENYKPPQNTQHEKEKISKSKNITDTKIETYELSREKPVILMNKNLMARVRENKKDEYFSEVPFLNYLREDMRLMLKDICDEKPLFGYVSTKNPDISTVYNLSRSLDQLAINRLSNFGYKKAIENYFFNILSGIVTDNLYIIVIFDANSIFIIARPKEDNPRVKFFKIPIENIQDVFPGEEGLYLKLKDEKFIILENIIPEYSKLAQNVIKTHNFISNQKIDYFGKQLKKLETLYNAGILNYNDFMIKKEELENLRKKVFSPENIDRLLEKQLTIGNKMKEFNSMLQNQFGQDYALFLIDIVGFTDAVEKKGTVNMMAILNQYEKMVLNNVTVLDGRIVKKMGDGILGVFNSAENCITGITRIFNELEELNKKFPDDMKIKLRAVLNYGNVFVKNNDIFGGPVNILSRIEKLAGEGEILCTEEFVLKLPSHSDFILCGEKELKGFTGKYKIYKKI